MYPSFIHNFVLALQGLGGVSYPSQPGHYSITLVELNELKKELEGLVNCSQYLVFIIHKLLYLKIRNYFYIETIK